MITTALVNGRVLTPSGFDETKAVLIRDGQISAILSDTDLPSDIHRHDLEGGLLAPGFIDTQVNGGGGVLFNDTPTAEGIHDPEKFRLLDDDAIALLGSLKDGVTMVTLAPETTTPEMIARLAAAGVVIAAGHTDATYETIKTAMTAGLTGFTHLFNAMSPLTSREPGTVGAALESQDAWCGLVVDGRHVAPAVLRLALRCRPINRFMLVTDAMPSVGLTDKTFMLQGREIRVQDGVCKAADGTLAGSDLDMAGAVRNAVSLLDLPLEQALAIASSAPADFLGMAHRRGHITPGMEADLVLLDRNLTVRQVWIKGRIDR